MLSTLPSNGQLKSIIWQRFLSFCTTMTSGLLPYISWPICTVQSHSILHLSFSITTSSFCLYHFSFTYIHIFYIFPNGSAIQTNHVVFYTPSGLTCCICLTHDLHSSQLSHTFYIYCFFFGLINLCFYVIDSHSLFLCSNY